MPLHIDAKTPADLQKGILNSKKESKVGANWNGALYRLACQGGARTYVCAGKLWAERRRLALRSARAELGGYSKMPLRSSATSQCIDRQRTRTAEDQRHQAGDV